MYLLILRSPPALLPPEAAGAAWMNQAGILPACPPNSQKTLPEIRTEGKKQRRG